MEMQGNNKCLMCGLCSVKPILLTFVMQVYTVSVKGQMCSIKLIYWHETKYNLI